MSYLQYKIKGRFVFKKDIVINPVYVCKNCDYEIEYSKQKKYVLSKKNVGHIYCLMEII